MVLILVNAVTAFAGCYESILFWYTPSLVVKYFFSMIYFLSHVLIMPLISIYCMTQVKNWFELPIVERHLITVPAVLCEILILVNPFINFVFSYDENNQYHREKGMVVLYVVLCLYLIMTAYTIIKYWKKYIRVQRISILFIYVFMIMGVVIQLVTRTVRIETFCLLFAFLVMFFIIQKPNGQTDNETGLYNRYAFEEIVNQHLFLKEKTNIVVMIIRNYSSKMLRKGKESGSIIEGIISTLREISSGSSIFRIEENVFAIDLNKENTDTVVNAIKDKFTGVITVDEAEYVIDIGLLKLNIPEDIDNMERLTAIINNSIFANHNKEILTINDFDFKKLERQYKVNQALKNLLHSKDFEVVYTPLYDMSKRSISSALSSVRFYDSECGYVYENDIFSYAEKSGQYEDIACAMFEKSLDFIKKKYVDDRHFDFFLYNIDSVTYMKKGLLDRYEELVEKKNINRNIIVFAVTEQFISKYGREIDSVLMELHNKGYKLCLSGYGKGYTNIETLYSQPFDYLCISSNLIRDAKRNEKAKTSLETAISMANELNYKVIIKGVEDKKEFEMVEAMGCSYVMGEYFYEDVDEQRLLELVDDSRSTKK